MCKKLSVFLQLYLKNTFFQSENGLLCCLGRQSCVLYIVKSIKNRAILFGCLQENYYFCTLLSQCVSPIKQPSKRMSNTQYYNEIFRHAIDDYHVTNDVDHPISNPYDRDTLENRLYLKCWIDTVQWHLEDIIRDPHIDPLDALQLKRRIDRSNQDRTDLVEQIDSYYLHLYSDVNVLPDARINTESPAWAIDRLSILALKIYHMQEQVERQDADPAHIEKCRSKLAVLLEQQKDLSTAIDQLLEDISAGRKYMKVYKQMKMYNDPSTNPVLYGKKG